jgi:hypothetical protein
VVAVARVPLLLLLLCSLTFRAAAVVMDAREVDVITATTIFLNSRQAIDK